MSYYVSRQCYWPDGNNVVEIATGGSDYSNPDMLVAKWPKLGEGETFDDPREAVEAAIAICREWRKQVKCSIAHGYTAGYTMPFEEGTFKESRAWAKKTYELLPKCPHCQEPMGEEKWSANDWDGLEYCSKYCAETVAEFEMEEEAVLANGEDYDDE